MKVDVTFTENEIKFISVSFQLPMHKMVNKLRSKLAFLLIALTTSYENTDNLFHANIYLQQL